MLERHMDAYYVPSGDHHRSEFTSDHFKLCEFLSGFSGEAAEIVITEDAAYLWTDGRFFIQAEVELAGSGIELMKSGDEGVPSVIEFLRAEAVDKAESSDDEYILGFDGKCVPSAFIDKLDDGTLEDVCFSFIWEEDLVGMLWEGRPKLETHNIWELASEYSGESAKSKIERIRKILEDEGADYLVLTDLAEIAWLLNLRGSDIEYTPVFYSYLILGLKDVKLYMTDVAIKGGLPDSIKEITGLEVRPYESIYSDISSLACEKGRSVMLDPASANYALYSILPESVPIIEGLSPVSDAKVKKNEAELAGIKKAHILDAVAVIRTIKWLKDNIGRSEIRETDVAEYLGRQRLSDDRCFDLSFETIAAYGENAAIVHYTPKKGSDAVLKPEGFLLLDSGGQYECGTTDITRTIALGPISDEMKRDYTLVLKSHIALSRFRFNKDMDGTEADEAARKPLKDEGLDFNHGVSHGVGHVLSVHEGPPAIGRKPCSVKIAEGMVMSNEPGVYIEGRFGIRTENLIYIKEDEGEFVSEALTLVPYEREVIDTSLLTEEEIEWVNEYHNKIRETIGPLLSEEERIFLIKITDSI